MRESQEDYGANTTAQNWKGKGVDLSSLQEVTLPVSAEAEQSQVKQPILNSQMKPGYSLLPSGPSAWTLLSPVPTDVPCCHFRPSGPRTLTGARAHTLQSAAAERRTYLGGGGGGSGRRKGRQARSQGSCPARPGSLPALTCP